MYTQYSVCAQTKFCNSIYTNFPTPTRVSPLLTQNSFHFRHVCSHFIAIIASIILKSRGCLFLRHAFTNDGRFDVACPSAIFQRYTIVIGFNFLCLSVAPALRSFLIPVARSSRTHEFVPWSCDSSTFVSSNLIPVTHGIHFERMQEDAGRNTRTCKKRRVQVMRLRLSMIKQNRSDIIRN